MIENRVHMGARYVFFTFGTHTHTQVNKGNMDQTNIGAKL